MRNQDPRPRNPNYAPLPTTIALGKRIRVYREALNLTLEEAASLFGFSIFTLGSLETAARPVTLDTLDRVAKGMGLTIPALMEELKPDGPPVNSFRLHLLRAMEGMNLAAEHIKAAYQAAPKGESKK